MRTSKPFSTISYNTVDFLKSVLDDLVQRDKITFYAFVKHYAEADELKSHIHLIIFPNGLTQTESIRDVLIENNPQDFSKPFRVMPFQSSKFGDWYLYSTHDTAYLLSKNQARKYHYYTRDFITSDYDYLLELVHTIDRSKYEKTQEFLDAIDKGKSFKDLVKQGSIPVQQFTQYKNMYDFMQNNIPMPLRNNRETHTPKIDYTTGEILEDATSLDLIEVHEDTMPFTTHP